MTPGFMRWLLRADTIRQPIDIATVSGNDQRDAALRRIPVRAEVLPTLPNRERRQLITRQRVTHTRERAHAVHGGAME